MGQQSIESDDDDSESQFMFDLQKAGGRLKAMSDKARQDHQKGDTLKFP